MPAARYRAEFHRPFAHGSPRDASRARLALIAGVAGVALPAVFYILIVAAAGGDGLGGWGAVVGTDTAFLLGALALVGPKLSGQLRVFLLGKVARGSTDALNRDVLGRASCNHGPAGVARTGP